MAGGKRPRLAPLDDNGADGAPVRPEHRHAEHASPLPRRRHIGLILGILSHVPDLDDSTREDSPPRDLGTGRAHRVRAPKSLQRLGRDGVRYHVELLTVETVEDAETRVAQPHRVPDNRVEHRLDVSLRLADHLENFTRRRLSVERHAEVGVACLQLLEQAHVLDGDDGLVGEGLEQLDLGRHERPRLDARHENRADGVPVAHHGHGEQAPEPAGQRDAVRMFAVGQHVLDVDDGSRQDRARGHQRAARLRPHRQHPLECLVRFRWVVVSRLEVHQLAIEPEDCADQPIAQGHGATHDCIEDRLDVGRRAGNDAQDLGGGRLLLEGHAQVGVARLQLLEQPHVLDGDDGLVGEGLEQLDLLVRERPGLDSIDRDRPDRATLTQHRHRQHAPDSHDTNPLVSPVLRILAHVGYVNRWSERESLARSRCPGWGEQGRFRA